jgi:hypothetical protein
MQIYSVLNNAEISITIITYLNVSKIIFHRVKIYQLLYFISLINCILFLNY